MSKFKCGCCGRNAQVDEQMIDIALRYPRNVLCDECYLPVKPGDEVFTLSSVKGEASKLCAFTYGELDNDKPNNIDTLIWRM